MTPLITATHSGSVSRDPGRGCPGPHVLKQQDCEVAAGEGHPRLATPGCCSVTPQSVSTAGNATLEPETADLNCCRVGAQDALCAQPAALQTDPGGRGAEVGVERALREISKTFLSCVLSQFLPPTLCWPCFFPLFSVSINVIYRKPLADHTARAVSSVPLPFSASLIAKGHAHLFDTGFPT